MHSRVFPRLHVVGDRELLQAFLELVQCESEKQAFADRLMLIFGSLENIFKNLREISSSEIHSSDRLLEASSMVMAAVSDESFETLAEPRLSSYSEVIEYICDSRPGGWGEGFRALYLTSSGIILLDRVFEINFSQDISEFVRCLVSDVLLVQAVLVILAAPYRSGPDGPNILSYIPFLEAARLALESISVAVLDLLVVNETHCVSCREVLRKLDAAQRS